MTFDIYHRGVSSLKGSFHFIGCTCFGFLVAYTYVFIVNTTFEYPSILDSIIAEQIITALPVQTLLSDIVATVFCNSYCCSQLILSIKQEQYDYTALVHLTSIMLTIFLYPDPGCNHSKNNYLSIFSFCDLIIDNYHHNLP